VPGGVVVAVVIVKGTAICGGQPQAVPASGQDHLYIVMICILMGLSIVDQEKEKICIALSRYGIQSQPPPTL